MPNSIMFAMILLATEYCLEHTTPVALSLCMKLPLARFPYIYTLLSRICFKQLILKTT